MNAMLLLKGSLLKTNKLCIAFLLVRLSRKSGYFNGKVTGFGLGKSDSDPREEGKLKKSCESKGQEEQR